jgi:hypothetical protein
VRERLLPDEELDVLDGPRVAIRANRKASVLMMAST